MRLTIAAVGRLKHGPERELAERYRDRTAKSGRSLGFRSLDIIEIAESRAREPEQRVLEESIAIANVIPDGAVVSILDERGDGMTSAAFAALLASWRDAGKGDATFVIGGADGLAPALRDKASLRLAFGALTWPHQFVRIMLLEQLYRVTTILAGHPYHRG